MDQFHFLRPQWLLALIPLCLWLVWVYRDKQVTGTWQAVCDRHLIPYILDRGTPVRRARRVLLPGLAGALAIVALAGPVWQQLPQPVFRQQSAMVVMLDLSRSMDAGDVKPSRLHRARLKLMDLLRARREGQTALIAYAGDAFVVTPLTDDTGTIAALAQGLSTELMPVQGSRPDRAVQHALQLLSQAGVRDGSLLLITDGVAPAQIGPIAETTAAAGHSLSVLGIGTADGAPIPDAAGGFVRDAAGQIVVPVLEALPLEELARRAGGVYADLRTGDDDINRILRDASRHALGAMAERTGLNTDRWREEGPWLLLVLLPLAMLVFRRGILVAVLCLGLQHWPGPAVALEWDDFWFNGDQRGARAMERQDFTGAAAAFTDAQWRAAAYYRAGAYDKALQSLIDLGTPEALYNRGNALARMGNIADAIDSFEQVLRLDPGHEDARHNLDVLKDLMDQQASQQPESQPDTGQQKQDQSQQGQSGQQPPGLDQDADRAQNQDRGQGSAGDPDQDPDQTGGSRQSDPEEQSASGPDRPEPQAEQEATAESSEEPGSSTRAQQDPRQQNMPTAAEQRAQTEERQANEQWLRRVPDDPAGLLRRKFRYQYSQRYENAGQEAQQW